MPSVDMRRTTRVFGVVKGVDGARVLRSGRRLWLDSGDIRVRRPKNVDDWLSLIKCNKKGDGCDLGYKANYWSCNASPKQDDLVPEVPTPKLAEAVDSGYDRSSDKVFGIVYNRKRKRSTTGSSNFAATLDSPIEDRMFGRLFVRRRRKIGFQKLDGTQNMDTQYSFLSNHIVSVVMESSRCRKDKSGALLYSVLSYMTTTKLRLSKLSAFLLSEPISSVYSSFGIHVSGGRVKKSGSCQIFGETQHVPMFSVEFSAVPFCYMHIHSCTFLKYNYKPLAFVSDEEKNHCEGDLMLVPSKKDILDQGAKPYQSENRQVQLSSVRAGSITQYRNCSSVCGTQKRRSSIRRKARNSSLIGGHNRNGSFESSLRNLQRDAILSSSISSNNIKFRCARDLKESSRCRFNILVTESDKSYREEGADVLLELSSSGEWLLLVKKNGLTKFTLKAENNMGWHCSNLFTNATVWNVDGWWKLEFPSRKDWAIFKDLYKECLDRNIQPSVRAIPVPVPGACEVPGYCAACSVPFIRPDSYISINGDEISRAMDKRSAIYDMDSDDDYWLNKLNNTDCSACEIHEHVSEDNFELMIGAFEKVFYSNPLWSSISEKAAFDLCQGLGRKEAVEAVYGYWMKKRKKRKRPLRIFQGPAKKHPFIPKTDLSKKTLSKRQSSRLRRSKHLDFQRAIEAHQEEVQEAEVQFEEAKASANLKTEIATISTSKKAQILMENADVATYKATIAVRIADAAKVGELTKAAAAHFLD